jgi:hypothetical protein
MTCGDIPTESVIFAAYRVLFPCDMEINGEILRSVELPEIKKAYRRRALDTHPDRFVIVDERLRKDCTERFIEVSEAYETLSRYLTLRDRGFEFRRNDAGGYGRSRKAGPFEWQRPKTASRFYDPGNEASRFSYWGKGVPPRRLRFGEFLYFSGVIPWSFLIKALIWQRQHRLRIGEIAQRWRWFNESQIIWVLKDRRPGELIGEALLRRRLISPFQLSVLLWQQKKTQKPIGEVFVQQGLLTGEKVWRYLQRQDAHNVRFHSDWGSHHSYRFKSQRR